MEEEITNQASQLFDTEKIRDFVLASVKSELEDWLNKTLTINCISEEIERRYKINKSDMYECIREIRKLEKEIEDCKAQNKQTLSEISKIRTFLDDVLTDLRLKAYQGDLEKVKDLIDDKCSWDFAQDIMNRTKNLATSSDFANFQKAHEDFKQKVNNEFQSKKETQSSIDKQDKKVFSLLSGYISRDEYRSSNNNLSSRVSALNEELASFKITENSFEDQTKAELRKIRTDFTDVIRQYQFDRLKKEVESKTSKEEFDEFIKVNLPKISEYSREFKRINKFIDNQEKAILRIDEVLCEKSSKVDLIVLKEASIDSPLKVITDEMSSLKDSNKNMLDKIRQFALEMTQIFKSVEDSCSVRASYDTRLSLIKSDLRDLENKITYKADTCEMLLFLEKKASWEDFSHLSEAIETVSVQTRILAAQLNTLPQQHSQSGKKTQSQKKITKKLLNIVVNSKPVTEDFPSSTLRTFVRFPPTLDFLKSRACTPSHRLNKFLQPCKEVDY